MERVLLAGRAFWFYLGKLLWPADLVFFYPRWDFSRCRVVGVPVPRRRGRPGDRGVGARAGAGGGRSPPCSSSSSRSSRRSASSTSTRSATPSSPTTSSTSPASASSSSLPPLAATWWEKQTDWRRTGRPGRGPPRPGNPRRPHLAPEPALREQRDALPRHPRTQPRQLARPQQPRRDLPRASRRRGSGAALLRVPAPEPGVRGGAQQLRLRPGPARPGRRGDRVLPARPRRSGPTTPTPTSTSATPSS